MMRDLLFAAMVVAGIAISHPAHAQGKRGVVWDNRPSIVFGEDINIDLKGRVQLDGRRFDPEVGEDEFDVRTLRIGLKGDLTRHFDWEIEREIDEVLEEGKSSRRGASANGRMCSLTGRRSTRSRSKAGASRCPSASSRPRA